MRVQKYVLLFAAATATFLVGGSAYTGYRYVGSLLFPAAVEMPAALTTEFATEPIIAAEFSSEPTDAAPELNLTGAYYIFEETLPRGFHDFDSVDISTHDYVPGTESDHWIPIPPKGSLQAKRNYKFAAVSVSPDFVTFETESIKGVQYRFTGKYHPYNDENEGDTINGTLMKLEFGKVIAKMEVTFSPGGC